MAFEFSGAAIDEVDRLRAENARLRGERDRAAECAVQALKLRGVIRREAVQSILISIGGVIAGADVAAALAEHDKQAAERNENQ